MAPRFKALRRRLFSPLLPAVEGMFEMALRRQGLLHDGEHLLAQFAGRMLYGAVEGIPFGSADIWYVRASNRGFVRDTTYCGYTPHRLILFGTTGWTWSCDLAQLWRVDPIGDSELGLVYSCPLATQVVWRCTDSTAATKVPDLVSGIERHRQECLDSSSPEMRAALDSLRDELHADGSLAQPAPMELPMPTLFQAIGADDLNPHVWENLCLGVASICRNHPVALGAFINGWAYKDPTQVRLAQVYALRLLEQRIRALLGASPLPEDLDSLAKTIFPQWQRFSAADLVVLQTVLRMAVGQPFDKGLVEGRALLVLSSALGVLIDDPATELAAMRQDLSQWCADHADQIGDITPRHT